MQDSLTPEVQERDLTVRRADFARDIQSFLHFAVGCVFGRYKVPGYHPRVTDALPISGELPNDLVTQVVSFIRCLFGEVPLEENLEFIASALGGSGSPLEKIRAYYTYSFYRDHCKMYKKRPIYWLFNGGACKALCYIHAYHESTLSHMLEYFTETRLRLEEKAKCAECSRGKAAVRLKQLKRLEQYAGKLEKAASRRIRLNLDDGVLVNYSKVQNGQNLLSPLK